jgi:hypothetical protein
VLEVRERHIVVEQEEEHHGSMSIGLVVLHLMIGSSSGGAGGKSLLTYVRNEYDSDMQEEELEIQVAHIEQAEQMPE